MNGIRQHWLGRALLFGAIAVLLQQVALPYTLTVQGTQPASASLAHLHVGFMLAIAMLDRDRRVFMAASAIVFVGWMFRALQQDYQAHVLVLGLFNAIATVFWTLFCVRLMGWPQSMGTMRIDRDGLPRMFAVALALYPLGMTLMWAVVNYSDGLYNQISSCVQMLFAKHFGVSIMTVPLVAAWTERNRDAEPLSIPRLRWALLWLTLLVLSAIMSDAVLSPLSGQRDRGLVLMDYRFMLFATLAWCVLHLRPALSMPLLSVTMLLLVRSLGGTAEYGATTVGFVNLVHLAVELGILLIAMMYFHVVDRDARDLAARLVEESRRDAATHLPNLNALIHRLGTAPPNSRKLAYLLLDQTEALTPGFGLGTQARLMNTVAGKMADIAESYYIGTGQFALLALDDDTDDGYWNRLIDRVGRLEFESDSQTVQLLPYLGVAECTDWSRESIDFVVLNASHLAHEAKRRNERRPLFAEGGSVHTRLGQRMHEAAEALACLRAERVVLYFQPIRRLSAAVGEADAGVHGEVLCRLRRADGALLMPDRFMRAIEGAGRGIELDLAVLRALFAWLRGNPQAVSRAGKIAVNLTGQSLASAAFHRQLFAMLDDSPLPLSKLCFEIIETAAIVSPVETKEFLGKLRRRGCSVAIDDFGVGMQSFERLKELPVDLIKIDGSFIRNLAQRGRDHALVQASVAVAHAFGAMTVAEYVENEATVDCLRELGVDWIQGYLISRPVPIDEAFAAPR